MGETDVLALRFDQQRPRLRGLAYRMLGSVADAEDAVQEAWVRLQRQDEPVENLEGWLTTVVGRISLNLLRTRRQRPETGLDDRSLDPVVTSADDDPEQQLVLTDAVGAALLVVLDTLSPAERVAFVLHDVFAVPFPEIATLLGATPAAARKLASRARHRVQGAPRPDAAVAAQRRVVDAFFAAAREGRLEDLAAVLHPEVVLRSETAVGVQVTVGAEAVSARARSFAGPHRDVLPALVDGGAGAVGLLHGRPVSVMAFTVVDGRVVAIRAVADPARLARLDLSRFRVR